MFGKHFQSTYTGSMFGAGLHVFAVWGYCISHAVKGRVELNPILLAAILGTDTATVEKAIEALCAPDPQSRTKEHEGRRLIREGQFQYFMPTHEKYRAIRDDDDRRAYFRQKKAEQRSRDARRVKMSKGVSKTVKDCPGLSNMSTHTETDSESETETETETVSVSRSPSFPRNEAEARACAELAGCSPDVAESVWAYAVIHNGCDSTGKPIADFLAYLKACAPHERAGQRNTP